ncbi:PAS domain S-box protein, partial [Catalinimonas sp. 4WD22]|uniref:PAS domain-containing protein n=1 Tax=Catalinimonas locisalis TaxID=3133978 RepID=UPI0031014693
MKSETKQGSQAKKPLTKKKITSQKKTINRQSTSPTIKELKAQKETLEQRLQEMTALHEQVKVAQEEIENTIRQKDEVLEQVLDSVVSISTDKIITFYNAAAERMFGYSKEEVIGQDMKMVLPIAYKNAHDQYVDSNVKSEESKVVGKGHDLEMVRKDGSKFWGSLSLTKVKIGDELQYTAFIRDITEEKENKEKADHIQAAVNTGFAAIEFLPDGTILTANDNFCKFMGYKDESEIIGKHHRIFCEPEYANSASYKNHWANLQKGEVSTGEFDRLTKDSERVWLSASYTPIQDENGKVIKVVKIATGITDMVSARQQGENIQAAVDTGWAYIEFEPDGTIVSANQNFLNTMGFENLADIKGEHHQIFCEPRYAASNEYKKFWQDLANGEVQNGEYSRLRSDGKQVWLQAAYTPVRDSVGNIVKVIKIATDITAIKG